MYEPTIVLYSHKLIYQMVFAMVVTLVINFVMYDNIKVLEAAIGNVILEVQINSITYQLPMQYTCKERFANACFESCKMVHILNKCGNRKHSDMFHM